jgi:DNA-binding PadR family transcriptional regulator
MVKTQKEQLGSLKLELRRGAVVLAVLSQLKQEQYGYSLKNSLLEKGLTIDEGTLYPLLRRLESQGLLHSTWKLEGSRPRRYYQLNKLGEETLSVLSSDWAELARTIERLLK